MVHNTSTTTDDLKTVEAGLRAARNIARAHRYGGLHDLWEPLNDALQALERVKQRLATYQPELPLPQ